MNKQKIRELHAPNRMKILKENCSFINKFAESSLEHFANGNEINPEAIDPVLIEVASETLESNLFRFATLLWSVPVSQGFGRRMRFLVKDRQNDKLIGIFALCDPVFNLKVRDRHIGWNSEDRKKRLVHVMDSYVVGAVPPYSLLIGGKLVAALMGCSEVKKIYERKYLNRVSIISGVAKRARLVLLTTTSALGRSSIYNRLSIPGGTQFIQIGTTKGFGHFHLSVGIFNLMRKYLDQIGHPYAFGNRFGMGPNWKIRVVRAVLDDIGLNSNDILNHGIEREVYLMPLAENWREILLGHHKNVRSRVLPLEKISEFCLKRWITPRAKRDKRYKEFNKSMIKSQIMNEDSLY